jgi:hypothetical protein
MNKKFNALNWAIGGYTALTILGYSKINATAPSLLVFFALAPIALLSWQAILLHNRFTNQLSDKKAEPFYELLDLGDYWRVFFILLFGAKPLASQYLLGFYVFSALVLFLVGIFIFISCVEYFRKRNLSPLIVGCLVFSYFLVCWEKNMYVEHYGVPIIGHFLEKPNYYTKYRVEISPDNSTRKFQGIADINVEGRTETYEDGDEDRFGQSITQSVSYRDVWIKKLYLPNGAVSVIEDQLEPLHLGESVYVTDTHRNKWIVRLMNEPIH